MVRRVARFFVYVFEIWAGQWGPGGPPKFYKLGTTAGPYPQTSQEVEGLRPSTCGGGAPSRRSPTTRLRPGGAPGPHPEVPEL